MLRFLRCLIVMIGKLRNENVRCFIRENTFCRKIIVSCRRIIISDKIPINGLRYFIKFVKKHNAN